MGAPRENPWSLPVPVFAFAVVSADFSGRHHAVALVEGIHPRVNPCFSATADKPFSAGTIQQKWFISGEISFECQGIAPGIVLRENFPGDQMMSHRYFSMELRLKRWELIEFVPVPR